MRRRTTPAMLATALALLATPTAVLAAPAPSGHAGGDASGAHHLDGEVSGRPGVAWTTDLGVDLLPRVYEDTLQVDGDDRVLVQGRVDAPDAPALDRRHWTQAVDAGTGKVLWADPLLDVSAACGGVATDDGRFIGMLEPRSPSNDLPAAVLVAADLETGRLLDGQRFTTEDPRLKVCPSRLVMAGNLVLVPVGGGDPGIRAVDVTTWAEAWAYAARTVDDRPADAGRNDQIVLDAGGRTVYHLSIKHRDDPAVFWLHAINVADGTVRDRIELPGASQAGFARRLIAVDGGVVVSLERCDGAPSGPAGNCVVRIDDDGTKLSHAWTSRPKDADGKPAALLTLTDNGKGIVAGWVAGSGDIHGLDLATGEVAFRHTPSSFSNNTRQLVSDADGTFIHGTFGGNHLEAFEPGSPRVFAIESCEISTPGLAFGEPMAVGGISSDGTLVAGTLANVMRDGTKVGETYVLEGYRDGAPRPRGTCPIDAGRFQGESREVTAVTVSRAARPEGATAETVVLAVSDNYPDALAGGPLAAASGGPLLLTGRDALHPAVREEIERLRASKAILLGGRGALGDAVEQELRSMGLETERIAGTSRFDTARLIAQRLPSSVVYVTEGNHADPSRGWADAVAVSALASQEVRPILLVTAQGAPPETLQAVAEMQLQEVVVVGGPGSVSLSTAQDVARHAPGDQLLTRVAGRSRFATSVEVAKRAVAAGASTRDLWFATGLDFPDALTAGPAVASVGGVLLLVHGKDATAGREVHDHLATLPPDDARRIRFIGGDGAISPEVADSLRQVVESR